MTTTILGDFGSRASPGRGALRRVVARVLAKREAQARRTINSMLLGYDDATLATFGYDRKSLEEAGRAPFPL
jgi:hypothetical protein